MGSHRSAAEEASGGDGRGARSHDAATVGAPSPTAASPPASPDEPMADARPATSWPAPRIAPATYPGSAPDHPYLLLGDRVVPLDVRLRGDVLRVTLADGTPVDDVLRRVGVAPLAERVPMVAYGANRSPHSLALKFAQHPGAAEAAVPVLAGTVGDVDVVGAALSSQGFFYADLAESPGTRVSVLLTLLDAVQLVAIHDSEQIGRIYDCAWLPGFALTGSGSADAGTAGAGTGADTSVGACTSVGAGAGAGTGAGAAAGQAPARARARLGRVPGRSGRSPTSGASRCSRSRPAPTPATPGSRLPSPPSPRRDVRIERWARSTCWPA